MHAGAGVSGFVFGSSTCVHGDMKLDEGAFPTQAQQTFVSALFPGGSVLCAARQVHGADLYSIHSRTEQSLLIPESDGIVDFSRSAVLGIFTADCLALGIIDPVLRIAGAVHSGWKGSLLDISLRAVDKLVEAGSSVEDLEVYFSPSILPCCYEVGPEFRELFPEEALQFRGAGMYFDNQGYVAGRLVQRGIAASRVFTNPCCTCCNEREFFSYRRQGMDAGRMLTLIGPG